MPQLPIDPDTVPPEVLALIKLREGWKTVVYRDTSPKKYPTAGTGHKLLASELETYPVGSTVPDNVLQAWEASDTLHAYQSAITHASLIGVNDPRLIDGLTAAIFQLGANFQTEFPTLWKLLLAHSWDAAAADAGTTLWDRQTKVRVEDFQAALRSLDPPAPVDAA